MSPSVVVLAAATILILAWAKVVLTDEKRYLRAVAPLADHPAISRAAGVVVSHKVRRLRWAGQRCSPRTARCLGRSTTRLVRTRAIGALWVQGNRAMHRRRRRSARVAATMIGLAAVGSIVNLTRVRNSASLRYAGRQ